MSRWRDLLIRRASDQDDARDVDLAGARREAPEAPEGRELVVAVAGGVATFEDRLRDDPGGQWPLLEPLDGPPGSRVLPADVRADALWFLARTTIAPRRAVIERLTSLAAGCGARVMAVAPLDVATEVDPAWLDQQLLRSDQDGPGSVARTRLEHLAGREVVDRLVSLLRDTAVDRRVRRSAARALPDIVWNAPVDGVPDRVVAVAAEIATGDAFDQRLSGRLLRGLSQGQALVSHGLVVLQDEAALARLADHPGWRISGASLDLLLARPGRLRPETVATLLAIARTGLDPDEQALPGVERAVACLAKAGRGAEVVELVREIAQSSPSPQVRREAAATLVHLLGDDAKQVWIALLSSTSVGDIAAGERLLRRFGTADDVPVAVLAAHRLLRRRATEPRVVRHPPRGAELLAFLDRHRGRVEVDKLFVEVAARWDHLPEELRAWIREHLPWLGPLT